MQKFMSVNLFIINITLLLFLKCNNHKDFPVSDEENHVTEKFESLTIIKVGCLQSTLSNQNLKEYFHHFPNDFTTFKYYFQNYEDRIYLYENAMTCLEKFKKTKNIVGEKEYLSKVYNISKHANWDADAVSYFQTEILIPELLSNQNFFIQFFNENYDDSIWKFAFDGPAPEHIEKLEIKDKLLLLYPDYKKDIEEKYNEVVVEWKQGI